MAVQHMLRFFVIYDLLPFIVPMKAVACAERNVRQQAGLSEPMPISQVARCLEIT